MRNVDVSVIVPVYNVEEYLGDCLDSLLTQGNVNIEVIMIDDDSTDSSKEIAMRYADLHDNFHYYHTENRGPGHARNLGAKFAKGEYIALCDSDDLVPKNTYSKMLRLARETGAEVTCCHVDRFDTKRSWVSELHKKAYAGCGQTAHIKNNHSLLYDTTAYTKFIKRDFYEKNNLLFLEGIIYEDIPFSLNAFIKCNKCAITKEIGYRWRYRDGKTRSLTQNPKLENNLRDRIIVLKSLREIYDSEELGREFAIAAQHKMLDVDLKLFINGLNTVSEETGYRMLDSINGFIKEEISDEAFAGLSILDRQKYEYVKDNNLQAIIKLLDYKDYKKEAIHENNGRLTIDLPEKLFTISDRDVTEEFKQNPPSVFVDDVIRADDGFEVKAHLYWRRFSLAPGDQNIRTYLTNNINSIELETEPYITTNLTKNFGKVTSSLTGEECSYNYDGAGFKFFIGTEKLKELGSNEGAYHIEIEYKNRLFAGREILKGAKKTLIDRVDQILTSRGNTSIKCFFTPSEELNFLINNDSLFIKESEVEGNSFLISINKDVNRLFALPYLGNSDEKICLEKTDEHTHRLDLKELVPKRYYYFTEGEDETDIVLSEDRGATFFTDSIPTLLTTYKLNTPIIMCADALTCLESFRKKSTPASASAAVKTKRYMSAKSDRCPVGARIIYMDKLTESARCIAEAETVGNSELCECRFTIDLSDEELCSNLYAGRRELFVEYIYNDGYKETDLLYSKKCFVLEYEEDTLKSKVYLSMYASMRLQSSQVWPENQLTLQKRRAIIEKEYPEYRQEKLEKRSILFESSSGRCYGGAPRDVYRYVSEKYPKYECIWALRDARTPIEGDSKRIRKGTPEYYHCLATAKYIFTDEALPDDFIKRDDQIVVMTKEGSVADLVKKALKHNSVTNILNYLRHIIGGK